MATNVQVPQKKWQNPEKGLQSFENLGIIHIKKLVKIPHFPHWVIFLTFSQKKQVVIKMHFKP